MYLTHILITVRLKDMMKRRILPLLLALLLMAASLGALAAEKVKYNMPYYIEVDVFNQIVTIYSLQKS